MEFTGERFTPDCVREIWYEHWHRYVFAGKFAEGKDVLDLACGEGYGSHLLSFNARSVTGVDASDQAVAHAVATYRSENLSYRQGQAEAIPLPDHSVDLVVSFETIEHLEPQQQMLAEFNRVLRDDGMLIISSPDKKTYSDDRNYQNEFHVRELYRDELEKLLGEHFNEIKLYGQKLMFQSCILPLQQPAEHCELAILDRQNMNLRTQEEAWQPLYFIALCGKQALPESAQETTASLFSDVEESVYEHYYHEIRKNIAAGGILQERDQTIRELQEQVTALQQQLSEQS